MNSLCLLRKSCRDSFFVHLCVGVTVLGSNPGGSEIFRTRPDRPQGSTQPPVQEVPGFFPGGKAAGA